MGPGVSLGIDALYPGRQWLRGDEANVTAPLDAHDATFGTLTRTASPAHSSGSSRRFVPAARW